MGEIKDLQISFENISVTTIGPSAGIFFGTNNAVSWNSHSKVNTGLGVAGDAARNNISIVFDNDMIDAPIDDRDCIINPRSYQRGDQPTQLTINFDNVEVNSLSTNSSIAVGENYQPGWDSHSKSNTGNGSFFGNSRTSKNLNVIVDNDIVDAPINDQDIKPSFVKKIE